MEQLADILDWLGPHALWLALLLPPLIRLVGHVVPEELFMVAMGVLAARSASPQRAAGLLAVLFASHLVTDQGVYLAGCWLRGRLRRFPRVQLRLERVSARLESSPSALLSLIPARVLPLGRAAWLASCGVVKVPWPRFAAIDLAALVLHVGLWCGLGWWLAGDIARLQRSVDVGRIAAVWVAVALVAAVLAILLWRARPEWHGATEQAFRRAGRSLRFRGEE